MMTIFREHLSNKNSLNNAMKKTMKLFYWEQLNRIGHEGNQQIAM